MPVLFAKLMSLVESDESSIAEVAAVISQDTGMTAKVLQLVNSSFFGLRRTVTDPRQAVLLLGLDNIVALALGTHIFTRMDRATAAGLDLNAEHDRSMAVAVGARTIGKLAGIDEDHLSGYYLAGMLYDAGKLLLASNFSKRYLQVLRSVDNAAALTGAEEAEFGASHADVGGYLLGLWGLPDETIEAVAHHHHPSEAAVRRFGPLTAVHIASAIAEADGEVPRFDAEYLLECGVRSELGSWTIELQSQMRAPAGSKEAAV
jgi:HD-like signal output (HDOD) protein